MSCCGRVTKCFCFLLLADIQLWPYTVSGTYVCLPLLADAQVWPCTVMCMRLCFPLAADM